MADAHDDRSNQRPRRFLPQPVETTSRSFKTRQDPPPPRRFLPEPIETTQTSTRTGPRRFKPDLIETDTRSVRSKSLQPQSRQTESQPDAINESRFSYASLLRRHGTRRHSFRVPDLPSIPSYSSGESDDSKSPLSTSPLGACRKLTPSQKQDEKPPRESCDGEFSKYLVSLAAYSAQMQLEEQALAAFPNEQVHQPVDHFAIEEEDRDLEENTQLIKSRRQSSADLSWELEYMRQHKEEAEMRLRAMVASKNPNFSSMATSTHLATQEPAEKKQPASPPMLGDDLVIPQSLSPDGTISETVDMDRDSQMAQDPCSKCGGLWCAFRRADDGHDTGLWMGTCRKSVGHSSPSDWNGRSDLLNRLAASPEKSDRPNLVSSSFRKFLDDEFHDGFVTQIYNYLSLGYPCLARYFDHELSQTSGISIEDLRRDDLQADAKGYVVAPIGEDDAPCMRWIALRRYIHDWVRQQPNMEDERNLEAWGMPERKGSWAV